MPSAAIDALAENHPAAVVELGLALGKAVGVRVASRLGGDTGVRASALEAVVSHLAGELAVAGFGAVHVERWGRALVVVVTNPVSNHDGFASSVVAGALSAATGRDVEGASVGKIGNVVRFFVGSKKTAERVRAAVLAGKSHGEIVASLQGGVA